MKHLKRFNESNEQNSSQLEAKLDEVYEIFKEKIKSSDIEDMYQAEEMFEEVTKYLGEKLWNDSELEEWFMKREFGEDDDYLGEGRTEKASKASDSDVKLEEFRSKVKDFLKSKECKVKQVGDDFEVHFDGEHVAQVMFRKDKMTVKKEGSKFGKDFKFNQLGDMKKELTSILKK